MGLALALCAVLLIANYFDSLLMPLIWRFQSFLLESCCPKRLKADTIHSILTGFICIVVFGCMIVALETSAFPRYDIDFEYFYFTNSVGDDAISTLTSIAYSGFYYVFKLFIYTVSSLAALSCVDTKCVSARTEAYKKKLKLHSTCPICQDDDHDTSSQLLRCVQNHPIHRRCLDSLIEHQCKKVLAVPSESSLIGCPVCKSIFTQQQLSHGTSRKILDLLKKVSESDVALSKLDPEEQVKTGNKDCYMCPKCNFGPVAHTACSDLSAHDGHRGISNKCPKCLFFVTSISKWKKWDGGQAGCSLPKEEVISSDEAMVMDFCAVTLESARDMLRRDSNVQRTISNFVQAAPRAHVVSPTPRRQQTQYTSRSLKSGRMLGAS